MKITVSPSQHWELAAATHPHPRVQGKQGWRQDHRLVKALWPSLSMTHAAYQLTWEQA